MGGNEGTALGSPERHPVSETVLVEMARAVEARLPHLVDDAYDAVLDRMALYRDGRLVPHEDLRRSVEQNLSVLLTGISSGPRPALDLAAPQETGRRRARQSVPLPEVLRAYRITFATLWDALVERANASRDAGAIETLLMAASRVWQLTDDHALALTEGYRAATAELLLAQQRRRSALVEALLTGQPARDAGPWEAASLLGLPPDGEVVVVAAETRGLAEESLPGIERQLATHGIASGWRLTPALQLGIIAPLPDQRKVMLELLEEVATARVGVSPTYRSLVDSPRALQLARAALTSAPVDGTAVRVFQASPLAALMACEPEEGDRLAREVLGSVLALPAGDRSVLLETLHTYLDHEGSAERAGEVLYCHPNTVRYRLRRIQDLTQRSLSDPFGLAELAAASYAVRISAVGPDE